MAKILIHTASGEFRDPHGRLLWEPIAQGWAEAGCPPPADPAFSVIELPAGTRPDPRSDKWDGSAVVPKSSQEVADWERMQPRLMSTRALVDRFTVNEWTALKTIVAASTQAVQKEFDAWLSGPWTDVHSARFTTLAATLAEQLWTDPAVRATRMAELLA
jgi:hypothetical protein